MKRFRINDEVLCENKGILNRASVREVDRANKIVKLSNGYKIPYKFDPDKDIIYKDNNDNIFFNISSKTAKIKIARNTVFNAGKRIEAWLSYNWINNLMDEDLLELQDKILDFEKNTILSYRNGVDYPHKKPSDLSK